MKINTDLVNATLMISFISLVLVGTTTFNDAMVKNIVMFSLGFLCVGMVVLQLVASHNHNKHTPKEYNN